MPKDLRIVIFALSLETEKLHKAVDMYKADKAYMLYIADEPPYPEFKKEVERLFRKRGPPLESVRVNIYNFSEALREVLRIISVGKTVNHYYVDISGPSSYSAAGMMACMMTGATPFFLPTTKTTNPPETLFDNGKPIGLSLETENEPVEIATFPLRIPKEDIVRGMREWKRIREQGRATTYSTMIKALDRKGLIKIKDKNGVPLPIADSTGRILPNMKQRAKMYYKRHFIDRWKHLGWIELEEGGNFELTEQGRVAIDVFYPD